MSPEDTSRELKQWYDGYHFSDRSEDIYNPFSLLNTFAQRQFGSYWFETGTPTFLVELLKHCHYDLNRLTQEMAMADSLNGMDSMEENPVKRWKKGLPNSCFRIMRICLPGTQHSN